MIRFLVSTLFLLWRTTKRSPSPAAVFARGNNDGDNDDDVGGNHGVLLALLATLSDGGGIVDALSALLLYPLPFFVIAIT